MTINPWALLLGAFALEVVSASLFNASQGMTRWAPWRSRKRYGDFDTFLKNFCCSERASVMAMRLMPSRYYCRGFADGVNLDR